MAYTQLRRIIRTLIKESMNDRPKSPPYGAIDHDAVEDWIDHLLFAARTADLQVDSIDDITWSTNGRCLNIHVWAGGKFDDVETAEVEVEQCFEGVASDVRVTYNSAMHMFNIALYCVRPELIPNA